MNKHDVIESFWQESGFNEDTEMRIKDERSDKMFRCDVRCAFVDYIDMLNKDGQISDDLASNITLE